MYMYNAIIIILVCVFHSLQVISPTSEHLFQALSSQEQSTWVDIMQQTTEQVYTCTCTYAHLYMYHRVQ